MTISIHISSDGIGHICQHGPELADDDRNDIYTALIMYSACMPPGEHPLLTFAERIKEANLYRPTVLNAVARLRQLDLQYTLPQTETDLMVIHGVNSDGQDWVAGDIHGEYDKFMQALSQVGFNFKRDRLFHVGDLIDRGPKNMECLNLVFEPWYWGTLGNHERMALDALRQGPDSPEWSHWFNNGGHWIYKEDRQEVHALMEEVVKRLPLAREVVVGDKRVGIVHAESPSSWAQMKANPAKYLQRATWGRSRIEAHDQSLIDDVDAVVVGHSIVLAPAWLGNVLYIDTGGYKTDRPMTVLPLDAVLDGLYRSTNAKTL